MMGGSANGADPLFSMLSVKYVLVYPTFIFPFFKNSSTLWVHVERRFSALKSDSNWESLTVVGLILRWPPTCPAPGVRILPSSLP